MLVTGGGGFIGSTLVEQLSERNPQEVRAFDNDEHGLFQLKRRFDGRAGDVSCILGDVRDEERLAEALTDVDVVFHAAAIKHVELSEYDPFEAVRTNVIGTQNLVRAAVDADVESVTAVSTDKASNPNAVMGATKLLMERVVVAANADSGSNGPRFNCVRFGNVLGSTGSVVPVFLDQIAEGGPLTVTDPDMTRFIMSVDRAVSLVLDTHRRMTRGEVTALKMPAFRVGDLADALRTEFAPDYGYDPSEVGVDIVGKRPGERMHEKLVSRDELDRTFEEENAFAILPEIGFDVEPAHSADNSLDGEYTSADAELLSADELAAMVRDWRPASSGESPPRRVDAPTQ